MTERRPPAPRVARSLLVVVLLAVCGGGATLVAPPSALAHTELQASSPAAGVSLERPPAAIVLTFTERVDASVSDVSIYDGDGRRVPGVGEPATLRSSSRALRWPLAVTLARGVYTVEWRTISVDGHAVAGAFSFGVMEAPASAQQRGLSGTTTGEAAASIAARWLLYVGLVLLVGAAVTGWLALGGRVTEAGQWLLRAAWLLTGIGILLSMLAAQAVAGLPSLVPLFLTEHGAALADEARAIIACGAALVLLFLWPHRVSLAIVSATGAVAMLMHVLAGHAGASASYRLLAVADQWVHMVGVGVWIGGLAWLVLNLRDRDRAQRPAAVRCFSGIATITLAAVLVTGLLRGLAEVASPSQLVTTAYGVTLLAKVGLVVCLVALGAVNHYRVVPALSGEPASFAPFRLTSRGELALAACILAATAVLSWLAPAVTAG
jgi:copper transport protein